MGLPTEIINFFSVLNSKIVGGITRPHTISDFVKEKKMSSGFLEVGRICKKLESEGLIMFMGSSGNPVMGESYYAFKVNKELVDYGSYDFIVEGFVSIRNQFMNSVRPVVVRKKDMSDDIGTCFIISQNYLLTAYHCIKNMNLIDIRGDNLKPINVKNIWTTNDDKLDIVLIETEGSAFKESNYLKIDEGLVLDEVLTLGYPPIPGFDSTQISEVATINSIIKSSTGKIVGLGKSYLDSQKYFLINAKVKGGNSGGPILNKLGFVVGMIVQISNDSENNERLDTLGYGIAITGQDIIKFVNKIHESSEEIKMVKFENLATGFKTL